jgi:hypothetical protein
MEGFTMEQRKPTADEIAGMAWWNTLTEAERAKALEAAGLHSSGTCAPSAADAWKLHKRRACLTSEKANS